VTGTANFAQDTFPEAVRPFVPAVIGGMNLFAAILTTVSQFLKVNELMESHRVSSIHYGKLSRSIRLELSLPKTERTHDGNSMVDICKTEYDRLIEQSPPIPALILKQFEEGFKEHGITKPDITTITTIDPFDGSKEEVITSEVAERFKKNILHVKAPIKPNINTVIDELKTLRSKNLVSKNEQFYDCESGI
jgi:hypothetical protein